MSKATELRREDLPPEDLLRRVRIPFIRRALLIQNSRTEDVFVIDLGLSGVFIERAEPLPIGSLVEIRFVLPDNEIPIVATCRVAWWQPAKVRATPPLATRSLPAGAGIEFAQISPTDQERLREHLVTYCRRETHSRRFVRIGAPLPEEES